MLKTIYNFYYNKWLKFISVKDHNYGTSGCAAEGSALRTNLDAAPSTFFSYVNSLKWQTATPEQKKKTCG